MLFGGRPDDYPHPDVTSRKAYIQALSDRVKKTSNTWDPIRKRAAPWINVRKLPAGGKAEKEKISDICIGKYFKPLGVLCMESDQYALLYFLL
eukprot:gene35438-42955_t